MDASGRLVLTLYGDDFPLPIEPEATYWIVGGLGEIGCHTAQVLAERGATSLVLTGRNPQAGAEALVPRPHTCRLTVLAADVSNAARLENFELSLGGRKIVCRESLSELTTAVAMSRCDDKRVAIQRSRVLLEEYFGASAEQADHLLLGEVELLPAEPESTVPSEHAPLVDILKELVKHPGVQKLGLEIDFADARSVGARLAELLPIEPEIKQSLLQLQLPRERLQELTRLVNKFRG